MGSKTVGHDWATQQRQRKYRNVVCSVCPLLCALLRMSLTVVYASFCITLQLNFAFSYAYLGPSGGSVVKNPPAMEEPQETWVQSLGWEDPLGKGMATHSSILAWKISWTEAWQTIVHRVAQSQAWLKWLSKHAHAFLGLPWWFRW